MILLADLPPYSQLRGLLLLASIVALGFLGILMIVGLSIARHRQWRRLQSTRNKAAPATPVDPWEEAGRRMKVPPPESQTDANDTVKPF